MSMKMSMKVWNEKRFFEDKTFLFTSFVWEDIEVDLEAYEYEEDSFTVEPEGEAFHEKYSAEDIVKALEKVAELIEDGWEDICLSFRPRKSDDERLASFTFRIHEDGVQAIFSVNKEVLLGKCGEKLAEIRRILEEADA